MGSRFLPSRFTQQFRSDVQTLFCPRLRSGPSVSDRALALDRIAGSTLLACVAGLVVWLGAQMLPVNLSPIPGVADSAQAASGADLNLEAPGADAAPLPLSASDTRRLQNRLRILGFNPGVVDGIAGGRTLDALNRYRASRDLSPVSHVDRATAAGLLD